jgi:hypothetical protein
VGMAIATFGYVMAAHQMSSMRAWRSVYAGELLGWEKGAGFISHQCRKEGHQDSAYGPPTWGDSSQGLGEKFFIPTVTYRCGAAWCLGIEVL